MAWICDEYGIRLRHIFRDVLFDIPKEGGVR